MWSRFFPFPPLKMAENGDFLPSGRPKNEKKISAKFQNSVLAKVSELQSK